MSLNQFFIDVGVQLQEFIWRDGPQATRFAQIRQLQKELHNAAAALLQRQARVAELRRRVASKQRQQSALTARVEVYLHVGDRNNAWQLALQLDRIRNQLGIEQAQLQIQERRCRRAEASLEDLREQLADLECRVY
jgi:hypothetical protein